VTAGNAGKVVKVNATEDGFELATDLTGGGGVSDGDKGDITVSGSGATWTIDNGAVSLAKQADMASASVVYRKSAGAGPPEVQPLATLKTDLGLTGTNSGDQTITLTGDVTGSGTASFAATLATVNANTGTFGGAATVAQISVNGKGLITGVTAVGIQAPWAAISGKPAAITALSGTNTGDQFTSVAASRLLGRKTAGAGDAEECTLSDVLDFIGSAAWARLPAGTSGQFLKTNGTGANPAWAAGGSDPWTTVKLAADFNNPNTAMAYISDGTTTLQFTPPADTDWEMEARLLVWTVTTTNLPRVGFEAAAGANRGMGGVNLWQAGATATASVHSNGAWNNSSGITTLQIPAGGVLTASVPYICEVIAAGRSGSAPTAISLLMGAESAAASTCYIKQGSFLKYRTF
jgi:hypothetical protein